MVAWAESLQVPSENKILMIDLFYFIFFGCWGERERLLTFFPNIHISPSSIHTLIFASGLFHPLERMVLSHSYSISKSYSLSTTAALPRKEKMKG